MKTLRFVSFFLASSLAFLPTFSLAASAKGEFHSEDRFAAAGRPVSSFKESYIQNLRSIQEKNHLQFLQEELNSRARHGRSQTVDPKAKPIYLGINENQKASPLGLVASYPDDPTLANQAFTYDQALAGILMLKQGDQQGAKKIFDFYNSQWDGDGFWTVYNTQSIEGAKVENEKIMGPSAWIALFALQYHSKTGDAKGLDLATKIGKWISGLPHRDGGAAMASGGFFSSIFSVENNLSSYAILKILSSKAATKIDRQFFSSELQGVTSWLKTQAYDSAAGLFKRGAYGDPLKSLDTNSWAILVIGPSNLKKDFGIDVDTLVSNIESTFAVQPDGSFGQDALTAKGFDFSDSANAAFIGRPGLSWVEGTNHMVDVYKKLASYFSKGAARDDSKSAYYATRADHFAGQNSNNSISRNGTLSYSYADTAGAKMFLDNGNSRTASGPSVASSAWVYFSNYGFNPLS